MVSHNKFNSHEYESSEMINVFVYSEKKKKRFTAEWYIEHDEK